MMMMMMMMMMIIIIIIKLLKMGRSCYSTVTALLEATDFLGRDVLLGPWNP